MRRALVPSLALIAAACAWLPSLHLFFRSDTSAAFADTGVPPRAEALAARQLAEDSAKLHGASGEWDFMARTYDAWALANMALREPAKEIAYLAAIDRMIDETLRLEREQGFLYFLLPYGRANRFVRQPARSLFVDGEIALMLGLRRLVADKDEYKRELATRAAIIAERMEEGPVVSAESYPDECWTFCNAVALAALAVADALDESNHAPLAHRWIETAKARLLDAKTGLLVSRYAYDGKVMEGPEGSSIWMVAHALDVVDEAFARDQYDRAKRELARTTLGFGYAVEWPASSQAEPGRAHADIDSGPIVPLVGASAGSSGLALVASKAFGDRAFFGALVTTLDFAAFPTTTNGELRYAASNQVGDAVLLYATVLGPAWAKVKRMRR